VRAATDEASSGLSDVKTVVDIVGTIVTAAAVVVGAVWAYYRFIKDRTYRPRLDVSMAAGWMNVDGRRLLLARVRVKNIGASVVHLLQQGTGVRVSSLDGAHVTGAAHWSPGRVYRVFDKHKWIEPGETVTMCCSASMCQTTSQC
jgi:hypothetical protein